MANPNWKKGVSGNPGGRPSIVAEVQDLAREQTVPAIKALVEIMQDEEKPAAARVSAANALLDRGYGKPAQAITGPNGGPIEMVNRELSHTERDQEIARILGQGAVAKAGPVIN